jgi:hypothetical protein
MGFQWDPGQKAEAVGEGMKKVEGYLEEKEKTKEIKADMRHPVHSREDDEFRHTEEGLKAEEVKAGMRTWVDRERTGTEEAFQEVAELEEYRRAGEDVHNAGFAEPEAAAAVVYEPEADELKEVFGISIGFLTDRQPIYHRRALELKSTVIISSITEFLQAVGITIGSGLCENEL